MSVVKVINGMVRCRDGVVPFSVCSECPFFINRVSENGIECRRW